MGQRRLFVALMLPAERAVALAAESARRSSELPGVRPTRAERMHLTLHFLDARPGGELPRLRSALAGELRGARAPALELGECGAFPDPSAARVLWLGLGEREPGRLADLHARVLRAVGPGEEPGETRTFRHHVTLARQRSGTAAPAFWEPWPTSDAWAEPWEPRDVSLVASHPGPAGGAYEVLERFPLAGRDSASGDF